MRYDFIVPRDFLYGGALRRPFIHLWQQTCVDYETWRLIVPEVGARVGHNCGNRNPVDSDARPRGREGTASARELCMV